jgi:glycosyltransferase involved in cell wall biosynthesis
MRLTVVNLTSGGMSGGYRKYLSRLMPLLANDSRVSDLSVFVPEAAARDMDCRTDVWTFQTKDTIGRATLIRGVIDRRPDVVFVPTARYARFENIPVVAMVRNMEPLTVPFDGNSWAEGLKNLARAWEARRACRRATRVIAVSEHVRKFIVSRWQIDEGRIGMVYHGVDERAATPSDDHVISAGTLFTAGSIRPARGLEDILRVLPMLDANVRLTIAGRVDAGCTGYADRLHRLCAELGVTSRVTFAGQLNSAAMSAAFQKCSAFVMTSRAEACPNTALEAMSCGCAVVSVDRAPMPEFFGDAALYYPIAETGVLTKQIRTILSSSAEQNRLRQAARRRAARFSWEATRDNTIKELERALS